MNRVAIWVVLLTLFFTACSAPAQPTVAPALSPIIVPVVATPEATPRPSAAPTVAVTPTAFVTAPASGKAAVVPILMYHHLQDLPDGASELLQTWTVAPANFDAQMNLLAQRGYHTITMAQLVGQLKGGKPLPARPIVISFDDGWAEQYSVAFPILKKHNLIGTFFVYTRPLDHAQFMSWAQLQEMTTAGMDVQAHTLTHPHLRALTPDEAMKEISESKTILETRLGKPIVAFAYTFGEYNASIIDMLKRAGYESAVTLAAGFDQRADELFTLHRIRVSYRDTLEDYAKRLPY
jgi:peptidoglycan/xylan/chitin deacetylase (PgdA/CDA1 family)